MMVSERRTSGPNSSSWLYPCLCLCLCLATASALACTHDPPTAGTSPSATSAASAPPTDNAPFALDVVNVKDCAPEAHTTLSPDEYLLGVEVKVQAKQPQVPRNYYYGSLIDGDGVRTPSGFAGCSPRLAGAPLEAGATAVGFINFRVTRDARDLKLEYAPRLADSEKARGPRVLRALGR